MCDCAGMLEDGTARPPTDPVGYVYYGLLQDGRNGQFSQNGNSQPEEDRNSTPIALSVSSFISE